MQNRKACHTCAWAAKVKRNKRLVNAHQLSKYPHERIYGSLNSTKVAKFEFVDWCIMALNKTQNDFAALGGHQVAMHCNCHLF